MTKLTDLPDDILFLVVANLDSAREVSALGLSCRRFHHLVSQDGWRIFVRQRFPSLSIPTPASGHHHAWQQLAESVTWQSRCWDRRSLQFQALLPSDESQRREGRSGARRGAFMSVVDAHLDPDARKELVVWGAGEDIVARYRERQGRDQVSKTSWHRLSGKDLGLNPGYDDVRSVKVVEYGGKPAIVAGRWNGQLSLLSADQDRFGEPMAQFGQDVDLAAEKETVSSLDVLNTGGRTLLAAASQYSIKVYGLQEPEGLEPGPVTTYDPESTVLISSSGMLRNAKWMGHGDTVALALAGSKESPLRYLTLTPSGWSHHAAAKSERVVKEFGIKHERTICARSLTPVRLDPGSKKGTNLLLSSWMDGTIRLQDLRTPSPFDSVYQNNVDPWTNAEVLMAYGTERFIAGGAGLGIEMFDFRWPRGYYHTAGLPCLDRRPFHQPHQPFVNPVSTETTGRARCDHVRALPCHWHELSRNLYYRPNAKYFLSQSLPAYRSSGIWSLARASDVSPNFYIGISGAVIEANLEQTPDTYPPDGCTVDPNFGFPDWRAAAPPTSGYRTRQVVPSLMETGDGYSFKGNDRAILLPSLMQYQGPPESMTEEESQLSRHHRLDIGYQQAFDFSCGNSFRSGSP